MKADKLIAALKLAEHEAAHFQPETLDAALALAVLRRACREAALAAVEEDGAAAPEPEEPEPAAAEPAHVRA